MDPLNDKVPELPNDTIQHKPQITSFLKKPYAYIFIVLIVLTVLIGTIFLNQPNVKQEIIRTAQNVNPNGENFEGGSDEPPKLKNIGFNLDYYDPATNRAGDFYFTKELAAVLSGDPIYQKLIWSDYGIQDNRSPNDPTKRNVQPTFRLPLGTKVLAPIDGEVIRVETLYSKDYTIWFAENKKSTWSYEMEHVINPIVKVGDKVTAGQVVAQVSTHGSEHHPGFGIVEIGLFHQLNNEPAHWCPFVHFDDSIKDEMNKKILALYTAWETYLGDDSVYNNANYPVPGCATLEPTKG